ncbi:B3 domain-containing protein REM13-like isoform X3 [Euphorbia lathyris]|uniref:B3 domain-containing protein REM13-like isoform X3 n=1 Tax=Euphorbia lathyris TaxID=212925 RepID=UPI0033134FCC
MSTVLTKPQFFKPLISGFEDDFSIPVSFFKYLKGEECDRAKLRSQGGKLWPIKINGRRFEDGWKHFVEDHDLQIGDFLVFRHEGDMVFDVLVFDRTTCQREYLPIIDIKEEEFEIHDQNRPKYTSTGKKLEKEKKVKTGLKETDSSSAHEHPYCVIKLSPDSIRKSRLYIPRNFATLCGLYGRSCSMILKDEEEKCWPVKLLYRTLESKFFIGAGWGAFHDFHKLKEGDALIIELIKNGETPVMKIFRLQEHPEVTREHTIQINEPACSGLQEHTEVRRELKFQSNAQAGSPSLEHLHANSKASKLRKSQLETPEVAKESDAGKNLEKENKVITRLERKASSSVPEHPYCIIKLSPDSLKKSRLYIPRNFARLCGLYGRSCSMILKDEEEKCWPAKLLYRTIDNKFIIGAGWGAFHEVHKLKAGDTLIIELIKDGETPVMKICRVKEHPEVTTEQTFHNNGPACSGLQEHPEVRRESNAQAGSPALRHLHSNTKALELRKSQLETPEVAKESCSGKPKKYKQHENASKAKASSSSVTPNSFFVARITDYTCKRSKLYIPVKFSRLHFENKKCCKVILVDQEGRSWPAYSWHKSSVEEAYISDGWKEFSDANKLKMGDSFVFEFVGTQKRPVLQMRGFKANHKAGKNQEAASSSMEKPYTYVTVQASHVKMSQIKIPVSFAKRCGLITNKCSAVTIKNETGNSWLVALRLDKNDEVYMAYGWLDFVKENGIQEGDVFMLELVKEGIKPQLKYYALKEEMGSNRKGILEDFEDVEPTILRS